MGKFDCPECGKPFNHKYLRSCDQCKKSFPRPASIAVLNNEGSDAPWNEENINAVLERTKDEVLIYRLLRGSGHRSVCDYDESVRFRCENCVAAESAEQAARERLRN